VLRFYANFLGIFEDIHRTERPFRISLYGRSLGRSHGPMIASWSSADSADNPASYRASASAPIN
jgi:hypothetical protein